MVRQSLADPALVAGTAGSLLARAVTELSGQPELAAAAHYVDTFDWRRRRSLFLSYATAGDTRNRGAALLVFSDAFRASGVEPPAGELPDHLAVVLEYAATVDPERGRQLLADHRSALELLAISLRPGRSSGNRSDPASRSSETPYRWVVEAVLSTLPPPPPDQQQRTLHLAASGPPGENVGLEPFFVPLSSLQRTDLRSEQRR
jgi:nitrate reductase delta subunit